MYALQLPATIPAAGQPGGPPLCDAFKSFGGVPAALDLRLLFFHFVQDPNQLQPSFDRMMAMFARHKKGE